MAAVPVSDIEAVVFDLFGTLVYEFPRADWEGWLETRSLDLDQRPDLVQVRDREPPQDGAVAQIGGQGVHEVGVAAF